MLPSSYCGANEQTQKCPLKSAKLYFEAVILLAASRLLNTQFL